ncbi:hypothetical protein O3M35_000972 [Rhynocoris fuscipes]|uniref:Cyclic nucleotide-binding domain-containing protein n=1 Tax=Rhynocoris fuscipes TaxID=488301 RepID=A0AAW1DPK7_9HEMI
MEMVLSANWVSLSFSAYLITSSIANLIALKLGRAEGKNIICFFLSFLFCRMITMKKSSPMEVLTPFFFHAAIFFHTIWPKILFLYFGFNNDITILKNNKLQTIIIGLFGNVIFVTLLSTVLYWFNQFEYHLNLLQLMYITLLSLPIVPFSLDFFRKSSVHTVHIEQLLQVESFTSTLLGLILHSWFVLWYNAANDPLWSSTVEMSFIIYSSIFGVIVGLLAVPTISRNDANLLLCYSSGSIFAIYFIYHTLLKAAYSYPTIIAYGLAIRKLMYLADEATELHFKSYLSFVHQVTEISLYMICGAVVSLRSLREMLYDLLFASVIYLFSILLRSILWISYSFLMKDLFGYRLPLSVTLLCIFAHYNACITLLSAIQLFIFDADLGTQTVSIISFYVCIYSLFSFIIFPFLYKYSDLADLSKKRMKKIDYLHERILKEKTKAELFTKQALFSANANWLLVGTITDIDKSIFQLNMIRKKFNENIGNKSLENNILSKFLNIRKLPTKYAQPIDAKRDDSDESSEDIIAYQGTADYIKNKIQKKILEKDLISYDRQLNQGFISRITYAYLINISTKPLFKYLYKVKIVKFPLARFCQFLVNLFLMFYDKPLFTGELYAPDNIFRKNIFDMITSLEYRITLTLLIYLDSISQILVIYFYNTGNKVMANYLQTVDYFCYGFFINVFILHIVGLGFVKYFEQRIWTIEFFVAIIIRTIMHSLLYIQIYYQQMPEDDILQASQTVIYLKCFFILRFSIINQFTNNKFIIWAANIFDKFQRKSLKRIYENKYGRSIGYNDLLPTYHNIFGITTPGRQVCQLWINKRKSNAVNMLILEEFSHGLTTAMKSKHVAFRVLNYSERLMKELLLDGFVYEYEYWIFKNSLQKIRCELRNLSNVEDPKANMLFNNIFWLKGDYTCRKYLLKYARTRVFQPEQFILNYNEEMSDLHLITSGVCKYIYKSDSNSLYNLVLKGILPNSDFYLHLKFHEVQRDYLSPGNLIGEFGLITGRPYKMSVICKTTVTTISIPFHALFKLFYKCHFGRFRISKLWKTFGIKLSFKLFPLYFKILSRDTLCMQLHNSFVPLLEEAKLIRINDDISDVILIEGCITDALTRTELLAPLHITANNQVFILNQHLKVYDVPPRLILIPKQGVNRINLLNTYGLIKNYLTMKKVTPKFIGVDSFESPKELLKVEFGAYPAHLQFSVYNFSFCARKTGLFH